MTKPPAGCNARSSRRLRSCDPAVIARQCKKSPSFSYSWPLQRSPLKARKASFLGFSWRSTITSKRWKSVFAMSSLLRLSLARSPNISRGPRLRCVKSGTPLSGRPESASMVSRAQTTSWPGPTTGFSLLVSHSQMPTLQVRASGSRPCNCACVRIPNHCRRLRPGRHAAPQGAMMVPKPQCQHVMVIAGRTGGGGCNPLIPGDNDRLIAVEETRMCEYETEFLLVHSVHRQLPSRPETIVACRDFLAASEHRTRVDFPIGDIDRGDGHEWSVRITSSMIKSRQSALRPVWTAPRWQGIIEHCTLVVGAATCSACCAALSSPLAIMPSADLIPSQFRALEVRGANGVV